MAKSASIAEEVGLSLALWPLRFFVSTLWKLIILVLVTMAIHLAWAVHHLGSNAPDYTRALLLGEYESSDDKEFAKKLSNTIYEPLFVWTGFKNAVEGSASSSKSYLGSPTAVVYPYVLTVMYAAKLIGIRLGKLLQIVGLVLLIASVAAVDGLVARQIRKATVGLESATYYHKAKSLRAISLPSAALLYCAWPYPLDLLWIVTPISALIVVSIWVQAKFWKKYI